MFVILLHKSEGSDWYNTGGGERRGIIFFIILMEEGTCIAREECEDGAMMSAKKVL